MLEREIAEYVLHLVFDPGPPDPMGEPAEAWRVGDSIGIWVFVPGGSAVVEPGREAVVTTPTIYLPVGSPFGPHDMCIVRGKPYVVEGEPAKWDRPGDAPRGDVIQLWRADG